MTTKKMPRRKPPGEVYFTQLPGPCRKRTLTPYCYRMTYRNQDRQDRGCVVLWDVMGGRDIYQVALERASNGSLRWHCTCADAAFRGEAGPHTCKHVRGLQMVGRPAGVPNLQE